MQGLGVLTAASSPRPAAQKLDRNTTTGPSIAMGSFVLAVSLATLLGAGLRLHRLDGPSFWEDELKTIRDCSRLGEINRSKLLGYVPTATGLRLQGIPLSQIRSEHPEEWLALGVTEWKARIVSALIGILSIPCLAIAARSLLGARAAAIFAFLLAVAPWHLFWSQAARFYTQQFLFYNLALIWYFRATQSGSRVRLGVVAMLIVLAFLTQPPALVIVLVIAVDWLAARWSGQPVRLGRSGWGMAAAAALVAGFFLAIDVRERPDQWTQFIGAQYQTPLKTLLGVAYMTGPSVILLAVLSAPLLLRVRRREGVYLTAAAVVPVLAFAGIALLGHYTGLRYSFVTLFGWLGLAAWGCSKLYETLRCHVGRLLSVAPAGLLIASMLFFDYMYFIGFGFHERWREAFGYVQEHRQPGDVVVGSHFVARYYLQDGSVIPSVGSSEELQAIGRPTWLVVEALDSLGNRRHAWMEETAELKTFFDLRVPQPSTSVRVYHYEPGKKNHRKPTPPQMH
ncbi:MAG: hypothetical protein AMXMBFR13_23070 [Phycisphaerae bacterium]